jgi:hypothetical protein
MPKKLPEKEHSGTLKNSELFPKIQLQMQYYKLLMVPDYHPVPPRCLLSMQILNPSNGCMGDHKGRQPASHFSRFSGHPEDRTYCHFRSVQQSWPYPHGFATGSCWRQLVQEERVKDYILSNIE